MQQLKTGTTRNDKENNGIVFIRNLARDNEGRNVYLSTHTLNRMSERCIERDDVIRCISDGFFIEFQKGTHLKDRHPRILFYDGHDTEIYSVTTFEFPENMDTTVITAAIVQWDKWNKCGDYIERRNNK